MKTYDTPSEKAAQIAAKKICSYCGRAKCPSFKRGTNIVIAKEEVSR